MSPLPRLPTCSKCQTELRAELFNSGRFVACPVCVAQLWIETFPALVRPISKGTAAEPAVLSGESVCFYHETKRASAVCDLCGRFLCGICDCELNGKHYCPGCLESGKQKGRIDELQTSRVLHGRQALILSLLPFFISGLAAIFLAIRHWNSSDSLVSPRRWHMPLALVCGIMQTLFFSYLIIRAFIT